MVEKIDEELVPAPPAENGHKDPPAPPNNRAARRRAEKLSKAGVSWIPLAPRFREQLSGALMSNQQVKQVLEAVAEASGVDVKKLGPVFHMELEIQTARVGCRALTVDEIAQLQRMQRERQAG